MIYLSTGLPSRFATWCDHVIAGMIERALGPVEVFGLDTLEDFAVTAMRAKSPYALIASRCPFGRLRRAMAATEKRLVVQLDEPRRALADLVVVDGVEFRDAVRFVASSCGSVVDCLAMPNALVLDAGDAARDPAATIAAIAQYFEIEAAASDIMALNEHLAAAGIVPRTDAAEGWWDGLDEPSRAVAEGALGFYTARFSGGAPPAITWERDLFHIVEEPPTQTRPTAARPVDVTGRPRCLLYGPHIALPPGAWSAAVALGFSREAAEIPYQVEITAERQLASTRIEPGSEHFLEAHLDFAIDETIGQLLEVRVWNERAAFDGQLALGHVTVTPQGHIRSQTLDYFATALAARRDPAEGEG